MKNIRVDVLIQLVGMLGLLAGLIFVGLEMRQSQIIALSAQQQSRTEMFTGIVNSLNESGDESLFEVLTKVTNNEPLSPAETKVSENYAFQSVSYTHLTLPTILLV